MATHQSPQAPDTATGSSKAATAAKKASYGEVVKVDLRAERIAKREAEGGEPPSLFGF